MADCDSYFVATYMQTDTTWELKKTIREKKEEIEERNYYKPDSLN